jgi:hypothetical protein
MAQQINDVKLKSITALSKELKLCRKTIRERIKQGWNIDRIQRFYSKHQRLRATANNAEQLIKSIEAKTGEEFHITIKKITSWSTDKNEIAAALEISVDELNNCLKAVTTKDAMLINEGNK